MMRTANQPPRLVAMLLAAVVRKRLVREGVIGDLREDYRKTRNERSDLSSALWYWRTSISLVSGTTSGAPGRRDCGGRDELALAGPTKVN